MKIRIVSGNQVLTGVLYDNPSAPPGSYSLDESTARP